MFSILTRYLLQFKKVVIPHIGCIELVTTPAELNFAYRLLQPPTYTLQFLNVYKADAHQLHYIAHALSTDISLISAQLNEFGTSLNKLIQQQEFTWNGIGILTADNDKIIFRAEVITIEGWETINANKVMRENESHDVLIGDRQLQSHEAKELLQNDVAEATPIAGRNPVLIIACVAALLATLYIGYYLYSNKWQPYATGNKTRVVPAYVQPTYH